MIWLGGWFMVHETSDEENIKVFSYVSDSMQAQRKGNTSDKEAGESWHRNGWESPGINNASAVPRFVATRSSLAERKDRGPERQVDGSAHAAAQNRVIWAFRGGFQVCSRDQAGSQAQTR